MARVEKTIPNLYRDSVALMQLSTRISSLPGITRATVVMATQANIALLAEANLLNEQVPARPNDLLIIFEGADEASITAAMRETEFALQETPETPAAAGAIPSIPPTSLQMGLEDIPGANFALISTPGEYAAAEAEKALRLDLNVMVFSANVHIDDEIALKRWAHDRGLLMMGPDCGTAVVNGIPLGFANVLRRGPVGAVASAGSGLQEVTSLIDRAGIGISQALGCGGRDLSDEVGGMSMLQGLTALTNDASTQVIVLIAKHPSPKIARKIWDAAQKVGKPVVVNFLGVDIKGVADTVHAAETLEDAARLAVMLARGERRPTVAKSQSTALSMLAREQTSRLGAAQRYVRGLFSGGTFCYESQVLLTKEIGTVWSNAPVDPANSLPDVWKSREHTVIDLGDGVFTRGRPHPMIDLRLRLERIVQEFNDPETSVILLDVVLGYGANMNPATEIAASIAEARRNREGGERHVIFVASICGTDGDPQNRKQQETILRNAGVLIAPSNAAATRMAARIVSDHRNRMTQP